MKRVLTVVGGAAVVALGTAVGVVAASKPPALPPLTDEKRKAVFDEGAKEYDEHVSSLEGSLGIEKLRKALIGHVPAGSLVLEVAGGTGRNLEHYGLTPGKESKPAASGPRAVVLADFSSGMLEQAKAHAAALGIPADRLQILQADAHALPLEAGAVDVVIDTFGLCSLADPVAALREWARVAKPGGRILLLEHGLSSWDAVNWVLRKYRDGHAHKWGCVWDRDIVGLVRQASGGGRFFTLEKVTRHHAGTTYEVLLRVPEAPKAAPAVGVAAAVSSSSAGP